LALFGRMNIGLASLPTFISDDWIHIIMIFGEMSKMT